MSQSKKSQADINKVYLTGRLAVKPELRTFASGGSLARLMVTVAAAGRMDVLPVTVLEPGKGILEADRGRRVELEGQLHRRFWTDPEGWHSLVEVVVDSDCVVVHPPGSRRDDEGSEGTKQ